MEWIEKKTNEKLFSRITAKSNEFPLRAEITSLVVYTTLHVE